jgi:Zn-dependent protease
VIENESVQARESRRNSWLKKAAAPFVVVGALLLKFKAAIIPALKFLPAILKTGATMFLSIGLYAMLWGWWFAAGFVVLILVHECGHLVAARMMGLRAGAPVFIPFMGAFIALKDAPRNAWIEAIVGIGGPLFGALGAAVCYGIFLATGRPIFSALAYVTFFLNLFNMMPIGFLDGGRIAAALSPWLWLIGAAVVVVLMFVQFNFLLLLILIMSLPRLLSLFRAPSVEERRYYELTPGRRWLMGGMYFGLIACLVVGMELSHVQVQRDNGGTRNASAENAEVGR